MAKKEKRLGETSHNTRNASNPSGKQESESINTALNSHQKARKLTMVAAIGFVILLISACTLPSMQPPLPTASANATPYPSYELALAAAVGFAGGNEDWEPVAWVFEDDPTRATMVLVPPGCFMMGSQNGDSNQQPEHEQCFDAPFWIDETEVTRWQMDLCMDAEVCRRLMSSNQFSERIMQPVNSVLWHDAAIFCEWRGARLPTEREWEYAAAGSDRWVFPWGNTFNDDLVVYGNNSDRETADVGNRPGGASWVGALDMAGNVAEWVSSEYRPYPYMPEDGRENMGDVHFRLRRGGGFLDPVEYLQTTYRDFVQPSTGGPNTGFRCARSP